MQKYFEDLKKDFPGSDLHVYGDFVELKLRKDPQKWCFKIWGTKDQVKQAVALLIEKYSLWQE